MNPTTLPSNMDIDPLSYEYPGYSYPHPAQYTYPVKDETYYQNYVPNGHTDYKQLTPLQSKEETDNKPETKDVKTVPTRRKKDKRVKSAYCSEKITDEGFPFYGCSVCNISYKALHELDQHVTIHKNRMTSYRLRLRNQYKKKQLKKEKKRLKKIIKKEMSIEIEIKPEDGYIGNEKASDFINHNEQRPEFHGEDTKSGISNVNLSLNTKSNDNGLNINSISNGNVVNVSVSGNGVNGENVSKDKGINSGKTSHGSNGVSETNGKAASDNRNSKDEESELNNLEKIYKCFACHKQFTLSYYLKLHVRSHTDEKPYKCNACGQSFITASKLGRHDKRIHQTARFQCRICFKVFLRFDLLTAHFDKHHPEDKLDGEPYDYNAILPYLKELEEQLAQQEQKPKVEDLWGEAPCGPQQVTLCEDTGEVKVEGWGEPHCVVLTEDVKEETPDEDQKDVLPKLSIEVKVDFDDLKVKQEVSEEEGGEPGVGGGDGGDGAIEIDIPMDNDVKAEDSASDEDYFPSNTWAVPPAPPPPSPPLSGPRRRGGGRAGPGGGGECPVCHKAVSSASYMRVHMRTHTGERPFKCYKCGRGFITSSKMHRHVLTHQDDKEGDVKKEGETQAEGESKPEGEAIDEDDQPLKNIKCKKRGKSKASSKLSPGEAPPPRKHQKRPHSCEYCNQKFLHLNMLEVHRQSHAGEQLVLRCQYCLQEQPDSAALAEHEATHSGPKPYLCTLCGKTYKKRETMVYHRKQHKSPPSFVCDVCSRRFSAACKLSAHQRSHRARVLRRYECPVCAHLFHTKYHVHMHLATHQKEGLIQEQHRGQVLAMALQNARPLPAPPPDTSDERSRVCNICGEVFHHFFHLEEHLKGHAASIAVEELDKPADKKHVCPLCNKGFKLHYYLKLHSFTHSKEKPFICQQCGKGFITKGKLKRHLETHTGLKKYQCHICCKFFTRPSYLRIHIRTIHGTQDYNFRLQPPLAAQL